jgi:hypothetical protein
MVNAGIDEAETFVRKTSHERTGRNLGITRAGAEGKQRQKPSQTYLSIQLLLYRGNAQEDSVL